MATSISDFLGYTPLTKLVNTVLPGIPNPIGAREPGWFNFKEQVPGDTAMQVTFAGTRKLARSTPYMAPAKQTTKQPFGQQAFKLIAFREAIKFDDEFLRIYRSPESFDPQQHRFMEILKKQTESLAYQFQNTRIAAVTSVVLNDGKIFLDADGYMLNSSSGADQTIDNGVPAENIGNPGNLFNASWASASTNIVTSILGLKELAAKTTGDVLEECYYGANVAGYLSNNDSVAKYLTFNSGLNDKWITSGEIPDGVFGMRWTAVQNAFFANATGTNLSLASADKVTFTPKLTPDIYTMYEGSTRVIKQFGNYTSPEQALTTGSVEHYGMGSYSFLNMDPLAITQTMFDLFLPKLKRVGSFFYVDTTP